MSEKIKNIIIILVVGAVLVFGYIFFIKKTPDQPSLVSSTSGAPSAPSAPTVASSPKDVSNNTAIGQDFLTLLLSIKSVSLDDSIFSDPAFNSLHDSSISITPDGTEGRSNPFAPLGSDVVAPPVPDTSLTPDNNLPTNPKPKI